MNLFHLIYKFGYSKHEKNTWGLSNSANNSPSCSVECIVTLYCPDLTRSHSVNKLQLCLSLRQKGNDEKRWLGGREARRRKCLAGMMIEATGTSYCNLTPTSSRDLEGLVTGCKQSSFRDWSPLYELASQSNVCMVLVWEGDAKHIWRN